ncbi:VPS10 domain-containing protein [Rufibacter roseus]|uniref:T9SS type A sorting domain-containing protein n=1 Tax=Rufibacter roseus TaxID=1567108 RepID=A0ABW2DE39_9BACT|nr:T9SS type A sorting domain-containing protein [Rufibacter roseus]
MKKLFSFLFLFILTLSFTSSAQYSRWQPITSPPVTAQAFAIGKTNNYFFMASYTEGLYRSTNQGASWQRINFDPQEHRFYAVEVRSDGVVFAGGIGVVFKSTDHGANWTKHSIGANSAVTHIAFRSNGHVLIGTQNLMPDALSLPLKDAGAGVFQSTDNGTTWSTLNTGIENTSKAVGALVEGPGNHLYLALHGQDDAETGGVYVWKSGENAWQKKPFVFSFPTYTNTIVPTGIFDMALDGFGGLYVTVEGVSAFSTGGARVYIQAFLKTTDAGTTWQATHIVENPTTYNVEPVPESLFLAGTSSAWSATVLAHKNSNLEQVSGLYNLTETNTWNYNPEANLISYFPMLFAEDSEGNVYALEANNAKLYKTSTLTSTPDEVTFTTSNVFPNPATDQMTAAFELSKAADVQVTVLDMVGRTVREVVKEKLPQGTHQFSWHTDSAPAGTYLVKFLVDGKAKVHKVAVVR